MIRFENDYAEGAHRRILERLLETNEEQSAGYGMDEYSERAKMLIKDACDAPSADVHFLVGGTQTNTILIASVLRPHQGVISAHSGHIAVHETGAIEATGHKVLILPSEDGKINAEQVRRVHVEHWNDPTHEHIVQPAMVYLSNPTELGTTYSKTELEQLRKVCLDCELILMMDGARLGYGLASEGSDLTLADVARLCDVFYIGGTKIGALFGEAVVITNPALKKDFRYMIKQRGGLLAKGRILGIQFETLFQDGLYMELSKHAVDAATTIRAAFENNGIKLRYDSKTNQQFPILRNDEIEKLSKKYAFHTWEKINETESVVRFCTSWSTKVEHVRALVNDIESLKRRQ
ncbi:threonine aldolase family protein [Planococcus soli]|uniref:threonine aldolase family protein n=1 Tax=Planococcus soli TaxID=2666072 RepID=UPI00115C8AD2|nr:beta-eliminating lyase-related protein [Planococcus soli]